MNDNWVQPIALTLFREVKTIFPTINRKYIFFLSFFFPEQLLQDVELQKHKGKEETKA